MAARHSDSLRLNGVDARELASSLRSDVGDSCLSQTPELSSPLFPTRQELASSARRWRPHLWDGLRTVSFQGEERLHDHLEVLQESRGCWSAAWWHSQGWILAIGVGIATSLSGFVIEAATTHLASLRFGWCQGQPLAPGQSCSADDWVSWTDLGWPAIAINLGLGTLFAACSGWLCYLFAPAASGSGIPEVKTILNGFVMPDAVSLRTLVVKVPGLVLSTSAGMALGKEGPLVHIAVCWAQLLSGVFLQYQNEAKRRELFSAAAAAGVSAAFGAPLGGVLFSLEEVSSSFPTKTLVRAFTAAAAAALTLSVLKGSSKGLTLFSVQYNVGSTTVEYIAFAVLGVLGGFIGAAFNAANVRWSYFRQRPAYRRRVIGPLEVTLIALVTLISSWHLRLTRVLSADAIHALFEPCEHGKEAYMREYLGLCVDGEYAHATAGLLAQLAAAGLIRLLQTTLTFGTACPAGLFVPSLFTGACLGRCVGMAVRALNHHHRFLPHEIEPGPYAMVGAAAVLGGVCRVTISLVAIMLELTGSMTYIVPFMLAVLLAKIVGDAINEGIYDLYIVLRGYPFLQEEVNVTFTERCCDIMETQLKTLDVSTRPTLMDIRTMLRSCTYEGFPVVNAGRFIGYATRRRLQAQLQKLANCERSDTDVASLDDLLPCTDCQVMRMVPDASLSHAHKVFKQLGCKCIFLVGSSGHNPTQDVLQGIISKKKFLLALRSGRVGHMAEPSLLGSFAAVDLAAAYMQRHPGSLPTSVEQYLLRHQSGPLNGSAGASPTNGRSSPIASETGDFDAEDEGGSVHASGLLEEASPGPPPPGASTSVAPVS